ncbi:MAG: hypothetical protein QOD62_2396 [Actinomycetota bacterium]|nr:hypothetical protein [Actinomycetota bacterium]
MTLLGRSLRRGLGGSLAALLGVVAVAVLSVTATPVAQGAHGTAGGTGRVVRQVGTQNPGHVPRGYWLAATDGGVFSYGNAQFKGSVGALNKPIVGMATTPLGNGYWLAASDGGIFSFNVPFLGSTGGIKLNQPVVAIIASPLGAGYWLVASDGGVFNFGVPLLGSTASTKLNKPIVGAAATPTGEGYWLVASDGGIFSFGDAAFYGSVGGNPAVKPVVGIAATPSGLGYWLAGSDGGIFSFGDATFFGSAGGLRLKAPVVGIAGVPNTGPGKVGIFYYPWYGTPASTGAGWKHWDQGGHTPPDDIGATYYPARGPYSSTDTAVVDSQMAEIAAAGVNQVIVSWWGQGSYEDKALSVVQTAAAAHGVDVAIHLEPYGGRGTTGPADISYLTAKGFKVFYAYQATLLNSSFWAAIRAQNPNITMFANGSPSYTKAGQGGLINFALLGGFDGIYTYDPINFSGADFGPLCALARANRLQCAPSVAPGFDGTRATTISTIRPRLGGGTYDSMWAGAIAAAPEIVTITSYNEWHEGSQIEPAKPFCIPNQGTCYADYTGDFGLADPQAQQGYLNRTAVWSNAYRSTRTPGLP